MGALLRQGAHCSLFVGDAMAEYRDLVKWYKLHNLIENRVSIINQMFGVPYDGLRGSPVSLVFCSGSYNVTYCGVLIAQYKLYDCSSVEDAFLTVEMYNNALWYAQRLGYAKLVYCD